MVICENELNVQMKLRIWGDATLAMVCIIETFTQHIESLFMGTIRWRAHEIKFATKWARRRRSVSSGTIYCFAKFKTNARPRAQNCMFRCGRIPKCWGRAHELLCALRSDTFEAVWCNFIVPAGFIITSYLFTSLWRPDESLTAILFYFTRRLRLLWAAWADYTIEFGVPIKRQRLNYVRALPLYSVEQRGMSGN